MTTNESASQLFGTWWPLLAACALAAGCGAPDTEPPPVVQPQVEVARPARDYDALRARAERSLARAALLLPDSSLRESPGFWMSPLILIELPDAADGNADFRRFGPLDMSDAGRWSVGLDDELTVYLYQADTTIDGRPYQQLIHLWFYPAADAGQRPAYRGVRQILDQQGFGILWESLSSDGELREFYVAESLEKAAAAAYGEVLPSRHFSIESPLVQHPDVAVIRSVGEGPQPMGPYVYVDRESQALTTLRCRCEPAQIDQYGPTLHYQLVTVEDLDAVLPDSRLHEARLDGRLRWPPSTAAE